MASGGPSAIEVRGLECRHGERVVLRGVDFDVRRGEIFFVAGRNGTGKSTLLRHMIGLLEPPAGSVSYFGEDFTHASPEERRRMLRGFGVLYQGGALWSDMTLAENVALPLRLHTSLDRGERDEVVALKLAQVGLSGNEEKLPSELSGGMRRRAGLARALALDPSIVFFDEPGAGLDPVTARELDRLIRETRDRLGTTIVIVSHELASLFALADRMLFLDAGERDVVASGAPAELAQSDDPRVREFLRREEAPVAGGAR